jgi:hypothetical protein
LSRHFFEKRPHLLVLVGRTLHSCAVLCSDVM